VVELKNILFKSLYTWIATSDCLHYFSFFDILEFCYSVFPYKGFLLYTSCVTRVAPLSAFK
jgi:hypothetical protein